MPSPDAELHYLAGYANTLQSEALPGALPARQNSPRRAPYGLYAEQLNGTPFTQRRRDNRRTWLYRIRPSAGHGPLEPLTGNRFHSRFESARAAPDPCRWLPPRLPPAGSAVDFVAGLATFGGSGSAEQRWGYAIHVYAANADMATHSFSNADGELLVVPQQGVLAVLTETGRLQVAPGEILLLPRGLRFSVSLPQGAARGFVLEVFAALRLPERGPIGANGLADERHFQTPVAWFEDADADWQLSLKHGGELFAAALDHSPYDVVAWHGNHLPYKYDLANFNALGSVSWDHPDPSLLTVLSAPLDEQGRAFADFVVFPGRWEVAEHTFRPPYHHRNAATEFNAVIRNPRPSAGYDPGCFFLTPPMSPHGVANAAVERQYALGNEAADAPQRLADDSLWIMFESALGIRLTDWALDQAPRDPGYAALFREPPRRFNGEP